MQSFLKIIPVVFAGAGAVYLIALCICLCADAWIEDRKRREQKRYRHPSGRRRLLTPADRHPDTSRKEA